MGCVYMATNLSNGKQYIGKTTRSQKKREIQHWSVSAGLGCPFHRALREYGRECFVWEELYASTDNEVLCLKEQEMISTYKTEWPNGYNMTSGGERPTRKIMSSVWREKNLLRAVRLGKPVYCLENDTVYPSVGEAARVLCMVPMTISGICRRKDHKSLVEKHFCFVEDKVELLQLAMTGELFKRPATENFGDKNGFAHAVVNLTTGKIFATLHEACQYYHIKNSSSISHCCSGKAKTAYGYKWAYADKTSQVDIPQGETR